MELNRQQRRKIRKTKQWRDIYKELEAKLYETCKNINQKGKEENGKNKVTTADSKR